MNKTITIVAWRRPSYLQKVLEGLRKNNVEGYTLIGVLDSGFDNECLRLLRGVDFMPSHLFELKEHHGAHHANRCGYQRALSLGTDMNLALEDDTVPSPDCLDLVNWWAEELPATVLSCFTFSKTDRDPRKIRMAGQFNAWGWAARWHILSRLITDDVWLLNDPGWDISTRKTLKKLGYSVVQPRLSRIENIGRENGAHYTPRLFDRHFHNVKVSNGSVRSGYYLV